MTTRLPLVIVLTLVFASFVHAQTTATASPSPSPSPKPGMSRAQSQLMIIATEKKLWEAWKNKDMKPFRANISADAVMIGDSGVADKKTSLSAMEGMACDVKSYELSDIKVTFLNNSTAIAVRDEGGWRGHGSPSRQRLAEGRFTLPTPR